MQPTSKLKKRILGIGLTAAPIVVPFAILAAMNGLWFSLSVFLFAAGGTAILVYGLKLLADSEKK